MGTPPIIFLSLFSGSFLPTFSRKSRSLFRYGELDEQGHIVGLIFGVQSGAVAADLAAFCAFMNDNKAFFCVGLGAYRLELAAALVCAVTGIYVHV